MIIALRRARLVSPLLLRKRRLIGPRSFTLQAKERNGQIGVSIGIPRRLIISTTSGAEAISGYCRRGCNFCRFIAS